MSGSICGGVGKRYHVRVKVPGERTYRLVGKPTKSYRIAVMRLAGMFAHGENYDRGGVLMMAEYYDPIEILEIRR
jgi:hypothetical protein